jgi:uncharacterized membrane protein YfcA
MKKTVWIWIIVILFIISVASQIFALIGVSTVGISLYYGTYNILNVIAVTSLVIDIIISIIFVYHLLKLKNVLLWTDIALGYAIVRIVYSIFAGVVSSKGTTTVNIVELVIILIVWFFFRKHLKKVLYSGQN